MSHRPVFHSPHPAPAAQVGTSVELWRERHLAPGPYPPSQSRLPLLPHSRRRGGGIWIGSESEGPPE